MKGKILILSGFIGALLFIFVNILAFRLMGIGLVSVDTYFFFLINEEA